MFFYRKKPQLLQPCKFSAYRRRFLRLHTATFRRFFLQLCNLRPATAECSKKKSRVFGGRKLHCRLVLREGKKVSAAPMQKVRIRQRIDRLFNFLPIFAVDIAANKHIFNSGRKAGGDNSAAQFFLSCYQFLLKLLILPRGF